MANVLANMGLGELADNKAKERLEIERLEIERKEGIANTFKDDNGVKYFKQWESKRDTTPPPMTYNKDGTEKKIQPQINEIFSNSDYLANFLNYEPENKEDEGYLNVLGQAKEMIVEQAQKANNAETLKELIKHTTPEQREKLAKQKRTFGKNTYTIVEDESKGFLNEESTT
jgi:hypothetical protein